MKIEYWGDFTCPYTYIGSSNMKQAVKNLDLDPEIVMHSYELNPDMPADKWETTKQQLMEKDGMTSAEADAQIAAVNAYGRESLLPINFGNDHFCNTYDAHRLTAYAQSVDKKIANKLVSDIFHAVMVEGKVISDHAVLEELAVEAGLEAAAVKAVLESNEFGDHVRASEKKAEEIPIETIPYFVIDDIIVDSSKPIADFEEILKKAAGK